MSSNLFALLNVGEITVSSAGSTVGSLNDILKGVGSAVGVIVIVVALIKLIMGLAQERPEQMSQSSLLFGVGIVFVSMAHVLAALNVEGIDENTKASTMAINVLNVISALLSYAGVIILVTAIIYLIFSLATESPEQKITGTKLLGVAIGLLSVKGMTNALRVRLASATSNANNYMSDILGFITNIATYIGAGLVVMGIWNFIDSFKSEDTSERVKATRFFIAGIALLALRAILVQYFGLDVRFAPF